MVAGRQPGPAEARPRGPYPGDLTRRLDAGAIDGASPDF
jgi:hypothetical protein